MNATDRMRRQVVPAARKNLPIRVALPMERVGIVSTRKHGFTLIELLVVVAIISLLVSILLPTLTKAKRLAKLTVELSSLRHVGLAVLLYGNDCDDALPGGTDGRPRDHRLVRERLYSNGYLDGENLRPTSSAAQWSSKAWECPLAADRQMQPWDVAVTWHWGADKLQTTSEDGENEIFTDWGDGDPTDGAGYRIYLDGRGFLRSRKTDVSSTPRQYEGSVSGIVILHDAGEIDRRLITNATNAPNLLTGHTHLPWPAYDASVLPTETTSLMVDGHASIRKPGEMQPIFYDGSISYR